MANGQPTNVLQHIRKLVTVQAAGPLPDQELLERFLSQRDEGAFAGLVDRHGPMIWGVCRRILHNQQDAEDAFQSTFLILARSAASIRRRTSVGSWLYGVAFRVARKLRSDGLRRRTCDRLLDDLPEEDDTGELTWREAKVVLDEEVNRLPEKYRAPLVLCYLEGKTRDEAAQQLGWSVGKLRGQLDRGRERLRGRLIRRGLTLSGGLLATALATSTAPASVPGVLMNSTIRAAAAWVAGQPLAGTISASVAALTEGVLQSMSASKAKFVLAIFTLMAIVGAGTGVLAHRVLAQKQPDAIAEAGQLLAQATPSRPGGPGTRSTAAARKETPPPRQVSGRVVDADGKPVTGATVYWVGSADSWVNSNSMPKGAPRLFLPDILVQGTTNADGHFSLEAKANVKPHEGYQVVARAPGRGLVSIAFMAENPPDLSALQLTAAPEVAIEGRLLAPNGAPVKGARVRLASVVEAKLYDKPQAGSALAVSDDGTGALPAYWPADVLTDDQGRFRLGGLGKGADAHLIITHDNYAQEDLTVSASSGISAMLKAFSIRPLAPKFTHTLEPSRPVQGVVTAQDTGEPLAGVVVEVTPMRKHGGKPFYTRTDRQGRYRVSGHQADMYITTVHPAAETEYLSLQDWHHGWPVGAKYLQKDFALPRGRLLHGLVTDGDTHKPLANISIVYQPKSGNPHNRGNYDLRNPVLSDAQGRFALTVLPGEGFLVAEGPNRDYARVTISRKELGGNQEMFPHGSARIIVPDKGKVAPADVTLRKGITLEARILAPDGKPVPWVNAYYPGLDARGLNRWDQAQRFEKGLVRFHGCDPQRIYRVFFYQPELHLGIVVRIKHDAKNAGPREIRLEPTASVHGRLTHADGSPAPRAIVNPMVDITEEETPLTSMDLVGGSRAIFYGNLEGQSQRMLEWMNRKPNAQGEFRIDNLLPGVRLYFSAGIPGRGIENFEPVPLTLKPGEDRALGDVPAEVKKP